jgi:hypothetical protein
LALLALAGCGATDFANEPRAATPFETTASISTKAVTVSPDHFGAGTTVLTVANLTTDPAVFELSGPGGSRTDSGTIQPGAVTTIKTNLDRGTYRAIAKGVTGIAPGSIKVGPERPSSQNKLLEP